MQELQEENTHLTDTVLKLRARVADLEAATEPSGSGYYRNVEYGGLVGGSGRTSELGGGGRGGGGGGRGGRRPTP
jgi:hypothetical protein